MNRKQRITLLIGLILVLLAALFPPWRFVGWGMHGLPAHGTRPASGPLGGALAGADHKIIDIAAGRAFLLSGPKQKRGVQGFGKLWPKVDAGKLLSEIAIIAAVTGLAVCALSDGSGRSDAVQAAA